MVNPDPEGSEPFLRAIFAAPGDDAPRLIFADWLEERGAADWAELIRLECADVRGPASAEVEARHVDLRRALSWQATLRGLLKGDELAVSVEELSDPGAFRRTALTRRPEWYGARRLSTTAGVIVTPEPLHTIFGSPVTHNVTELDLSGRDEPVGPSAHPDFDGFPDVLDFVRRPVINTAMVEALAHMRECRRLTALDLRNNDLGNDALRALARSRYFDRLQTLRLSEGNRFRGRVWQEIQERFGEAAE